MYQEDEEELSEDEERREHTTNEALLTSAHQVSPSPWVTRFPHHSSYHGSSHQPWNRRRTLPWNSGCLVVPQRRNLDLRMRILRRKRMQSWPTMATRIPLVDVVCMWNIGLNYLYNCFFSRFHPSALVGVPEVQHVYLQLADSFIEADWAHVLFGNRTWNCRERWNDIGWQTCCKVLS